MNNQHFLLLSHCLLNQAVRAGGTYTPHSTERILSLFSKYPLFIYQLPCPEFLFLGKRDKKPQDLWEKTPGFKEFCSQLASEVEKRCQEITKEKTPLLIAIARSPCCSASQVYRNNKLVKGKGIWVVELEKKIKFNIIEFDFKKVEKSIDKLKNFLNGKKVLLS